MPHHLSSFQVEYLIFGGALIVSGLMMIITYSVSFPWWKEHVGRMLVTYAVAEITMATLLAVTVIFQTGPTWFRPAWFTLQSMVTGCFCFQTWMIVKLRRARKVRGDDHESSRFGH